MTFDVLVLLFPVVLAIHNLDECARHEEFIKAYHARLPESLTTRAVVLSAATALTIAGTVVCLTAFIWKTPFLVLVAKISICALLLNAIGHCVLSLRQRKWLPGTRSAAILVLPYGVLSVIVMRTAVGDSTADLIRYTLLGAITIPLTIAVFILVGVGISRLRAAIATR
jgi:Protein of unknown function with HXXEE motif